MLRGDNAPCNTFFQLAIGLFNFFIWECRIKKKTVGWDGCKSFILEQASSMCVVNNKINEDKNNINIFLSRQC
jgi:hypothetical protein